MHWRMQLQFLANLFLYTELVEDVLTVSLVGERTTGAYQRPLSIQCLGFWWPWRKHMGNRLTKY
jgi:hypothetical protein